MSTRTELLNRQLDFLAFLESIDGKFTQLIGALRGMAVNDVLATELVVFDAAGQWTKSWSVPYGSVSLANHGTGTVTIASGGPQSSAPTSGVGVHLVGANAGDVVNMTGHDLTLYGIAGEKASVSVFTKTQPPDFGGTRSGVGTIDGGSP